MLRGEQINFLLELFRFSQFSGRIIDLAYETKKTLEEMRAQHGEREEDQFVS